MSRSRLLVIFLALAAVLPAPSAIAGTRVNPFRGAHFFVDNDSAAARQVRAWRLTRPLDAVAVSKISGTPSAEWLGDWVNSVKSHLRWEISTRLRPQHANGFFVLYNLPYRDCGGYSSGGIRSAAQYKRWVDQIRSGIGSYPSVVIVEPDGLPIVRCLSAARQRERFALERYAVRRLGSLRNTSVYLDAGGVSWPQPHVMMGRLKAAGVRYARGFALNTTGFDRTGDEVRYGRQIAAGVGRKHFIVNTSRNGRGPLPPSLAHSSEDLWCNPWGRGLGVRPTTNTGDSLVDSFEWSSNPGYSDGPCNGGPASGQWWPDLALAFARNAAF